MVHRPRPGTSHYSGMETLSELTTGKKVSKDTGGKPKGKENKERKGRLSMGTKPIKRMGKFASNLREREGSSETRARQPKVPSPKPPLAGEVTTELA